MKTKGKTIRTEKSIDLLISKISGNEILDNNMMKYVRGGDGNDTLPPPPPDFPKI
ncbi:MAG TPA: hypothetical protein VK207_09205 [Bacteroidales bacterium]|jgi:hypothetical protein|nr:hypothetical protein [Bacteroidales bacterium]